MLYVFKPNLDHIADYNYYTDVIGRVVACDDLDNYDKNGRAGKKKPLTLIDAE